MNKKHFQNQFYLYLVVYFVLILAVAIMSNSIGLVVISISFWALGAFTGITKAFEILYKVVDE